MNTKSLNNKEIKTAFDKLFTLDDPDDQNEVDTAVLIARFLSEVEGIANSKGMNRKALADAIGISASYLTQVFRGNKTLNISTLAKFQRALGFQFEISTDLSEKIQKQVDYTTIGNLLNTWFENQSNGEYFKIIKNPWDRKNVVPYAPKGTNVLAG